MRNPVKGDIVLIDYEELNAIALVDDVSEDQLYTDGIGEPGNPAYKFKYLAGLLVDGSDILPCDGFIWLRFDPDAISIVGVDGFTLPSYFWGLDVADLFKRMGYQIETV